MAKQAWNPGSIERVTFTLNDQRPMTASVHTHRDPQKFLFDMHYELELGVIISGKMHRQFDGFNTTLRTGDVWMCGMWEPHGYSIAKAPCKVLVLVIRPQMLVDLRFHEAPDFKWLSPFTVPPQHRPRVPEARRKETLQIAARFEASLAIGDETERRLWQRLLLMQLLLTLKQDWAAPGTGEFPSSYYGRINLAVQLVFKHHRMVTAQEAAKACGMSRNHFNNIFQELMGLSFARFALRYRLSSAAGELLRTSDPVKTIAAAWGFTDASHLHHCFLQHYGCSPSEYRGRGATQTAAAGPQRVLPDGGVAPSNVVWNGR